MSRAPAERAQIALDHLLRLSRHLTRGSLEDETVFDAVAMRLSAAIEELSAVDERVLIEEFGEVWFQIKATRNAIAHNYAFVDPMLLSETVRRELPRFKLVLERMARSTSDGAGSP